MVVAQNYAMSHEAWLGWLLGLFEARPAARPGYWKCLCPSHERDGDRHSPSCSLWLGRDGRMMVGCWSGRCSKQDIVGALGIQMKDLFPPEEANAYSAGKKKERARPARWVECGAWPYTDENGEVLYESVRYELDAPAGGYRAKKYAFRRPDGVGGWLYDLHDGVRRVLYNLPAICNSKPPMPVIVVEGEKKADLLSDLGLVATCCCGGAEKWRPEYNLSLVGRRVVILPDNDQAGGKHAAQVLLHLMLNGAASVRVVELPGLPEKGDVVDWFKAGHTYEELCEVILAAEEWVPRDKAESARKAG